MFCARLPPARMAEDHKIVERRILKETSLPERKKIYGERKERRKNGHAKGMKEHSSGGEKRRRRKKEKPGATGNVCREEKKV